ncbi:MAG: hypothetical protein AAF806_19150 [Bacteroidota bacterium]
MTIKIQDQQYSSINRNASNNIRIQYATKERTLVIEVSEKEARSLAEGITSFFELEERRKHRK